MKDETMSARITSAAISDRGLSDKRPLNEDSFLADAERCLFVVADGVGGAQAGEVASQTAVEVLGEAFRHKEDGDIEDLMEIAMQRANASIHQMAREQPKLSTMATTVVALHINNYIATIGHVGDSRLYRLTPDGKLQRETDDHSMVEEEVRAGRMTPDQAINHPSRNIISRALGAEAAVDVDTKTIEVEDGTSLLLCSDGITRHIPDNEIRQLLNSSEDPEAVCAEMKRICYERGAEDNLTAVIVRVGEVKSAATNKSDDESTLTLPRSKSATTTQIPNDDSLSQPTNARPASRQVISLEPPATESTRDTSLETGQRPARRSLMGTLALLAVVALVAAAAAFYGGMNYRSREKEQTPASTNVAPEATPVAESAEAKYEKQRREIDRAPLEAANKMLSVSGGKPMESSDPEFLYLYGRALMLTGKHAEASEAFKKSIDKLTENPPAAGRDPLKIEARISAAAAALSSHDPKAQTVAAKDLDEVLQTQSAASASQSNSPQR